MLSAASRGPLTNRTWTPSSSELWIKSSKYSFKGFRFKPFSKVLTKISFLDVLFFFLMLWLLTLRLKLLFLSRLLGLRLSFLLIMGLVLLLRLRRSNWDGWCTFLGTLGRFFLEEAWFLRLIFIVLIVVVGRERPSKQMVSEKVHILIGCQNIQLLRCGSSSEQGEDGGVGANALCKASKNHI